MKRGFDRSIRNLGKDPETPMEWQEAVNAAEFFLEIESCKLYGLLSGGTPVNFDRCEEILSRGRKLGYVPASTVELVQQFVVKP